MLVEALFYFSFDLGSWLKVCGMLLLVKQRFSGKQFLEGSVDSRDNQGKMELLKMLKQFWEVSNVSFLLTVKAPPSPHCD